MNADLYINVCVIVLLNLDSVMLHDGKTSDVTLHVELRIWEM